MRSVAAFKRPVRSNRCERSEKFSEQISEAAIPFRSWLVQWRKRRLRTLDGTHLETRDLQKSYYDQVS